MIYTPLFEKSSSRIALQTICTVSAVLCTSAPSGRTRCLFDHSVMRKDSSKKLRSTNTLRHGPSSVIHQVSLQLIFTELQTSMITTQDNGSPTKDPGIKSYHFISRRSARVFYIYSRISRLWWLMAIHVLVCSLTIGVDR